MLIKCLHWEIPMETWCDRWMCVCVKPLFHKDKVYKSSLDPPQYHTNANKMSPLRNPYGGMVCDRCVSTEHNSTRYQLWVGGLPCVTRRIHHNAKWKERDLTIHVFATFQTLKRHLRLSFKFHAPFFHSLTSISSLFCSSGASMMFLRQNPSFSTSNTCPVVSAIRCQWRVFIALLVISSNSGQVSLKSSIVFLRALNAGHSFNARGSLRHLGEDIAILDWNPLYMINILAVLVQETLT